MWLGCTLEMVTFTGLQVQSTFVRDHSITLDDVNALINR
jgi:hypothetical protein